MTMHISKKTANRLGVLTAMDAISEELQWNYLENRVMREAFRGRLDDLEPPERAYARSLAKNNGK